MITNKNIFRFSLLFFLLCSLKICAQDSSIKKTEHLLIQFNKLKSIQYGKFGQDSINLVLQIKEKNEIFPSTFFIKAKLLGDSSGFMLNVPSEVKNLQGTWAFCEYIATASLDNNFIEAKEYANFAYSPFDYEFVTLPPNAELYLVPLDDWKSIFQREDIDFQFNSQQLSQILKFKILQQTPCHYFVFEQPYIGVFVNGDKIELEYIKPKRNTPKNNKAEIHFKN